ncbi:MAG: hypothetical protein AB1921_19735 [Thermodesulfobacteriota bacterium]
MDILTKKIQNACGQKALVRVGRHDIEPEDTYSFGFALEMSRDFLLLNTVTDRFDLDGWEVLWLSDVTSFKTRFLRSDFTIKALAARGQVPSLPPSVDLTSFGSLLTSVCENFPLVSLYRELADPESCEVGRVEFASDDFLTLHWISPTAVWENDVRRFKTSDVTRLRFGSDYEYTLALMAGLLNKTVLH